MAVPVVLLQERRLVLLRRMRFQAAALEGREAVRLAAALVVVRLAAALEGRVAPAVPEVPVALVLLVEQARQVAVMQALLLLALAKEVEHVKAAVAHMLYPQVVQDLGLQVPPVVRARVSVRLVLALRLMLLVLAQAGLPVKVPADVPR